MSIWSGMNSGSGVSKQFEQELDKRMRHALSKISGTSIVGGVGGLPGVATLAQGGTGNNLTAPANDKLLFFDKSGNLVGWLSIGNGLDISGTTIAVNQSALTNINAATLGGVAITDIPIISDGLVPPSSTPAKKGLIYIDTVAEKIYMSTGNTSSTDWKPMN